MGVEIGTADEVRAAWVELCQLLAYMASNEALPVASHRDPAICQGHALAMQITAIRAQDLAEALCPDDTAGLIVPPPIRPQ